MQWLRNLKLPDQGRLTFWLKVTLAGSEMLASNQVVVSATGLSTGWAIGPDLFSAQVRYKSRKLRTPAIL
jgi:hypothetical protein